MGYAMPKQAPLAGLVGALRAVSNIHQSHHWQSFGPTYYADHLLFERLYNTTNEDIDSVAERSVGTYGPAVVDAQTIVADTLRHIALINRQYGAPQSNTAMARTSLAAELALLRAIDAVITSLQNTGRLSHGISNLLEGIADRHEQNVYLLQQRLLGIAAPAPRLAPAVRPPLRLVA